MVICSAALPTTLRLPVPHCLMICGYTVVSLEAFCPKSMVVGPGLQKRRYARMREFGRRMCMNKLTLMKIPGQIKHAFGDLFIPRL